MTTNLHPPKPSSLFTELRRLPRPVYVLVGGQFLNRFGAFVFPFLALILDQRGYGKFEITVVFGALASGSLLGPFVGGYLADAFGRRNTIVISLLASAVTVIGIYHAHNFPVLVVMAFLNGFGHFLFGPAANALLTDLTPPAQRMTAFALFRFAINAGFAAGPTVAGLLFTRAPALIFYGDAATTVIFAAMAWVWLPHGLRTVTGNVNSPVVALRSWWESFRELQAHPAFRQFLGVLLLTAIGFIQIFNLLALTTHDRGLSPEVYGLIMGMNGLIIAFIEMPLANWYQRFPPRKLLAIGYTLIALGIGSFAVAQTATGFVIGMVIFTLGEIVALPTGMSYSSELAPDHARGRFFGFRGMVWAMANLFGSAGVWVYGEIGSTW
jgi:MFS family permease